MIKTTLLVGSMLLLHIPIARAQEASLAPELEIFRPLVGKTYEGEFANSTPEKPIIDVSKWERAMNGQAIRILHSINDGEYGGESILMWDPEAKKIAFWYFTTGGFYTQGTMETDGQRWSSEEKVTGNDEGITKVRSTSWLEGDSLITKSEYFKNDEWIPGHEIHYRENPKAEVIFR